MGTRIQNAKMNILSGIVSKLVVLLLPFITRTCIIYMLGTMYLGLNSLFSSILQILSLAELGFGEAMVFSMYKPLAEKDTTKIRSILNLYKKIYRIIGTVVLVAGLALLPFLDKLISGGYPDNVNVQLLFVVYLTNTVLSYWLFAYKSSLFAATQKLSVVNNVGSVIQILLSLTQIVLLCLFKNYYLYVVVIPVFTLLRNLLIQFLSQKEYPEYFCEGELEKTEVKEIEKRVAGLFIYKICGTFRASFDSIVISAFLGLVVLAKYENYYFIASSIIGMLTIISSGITAGVGNSMVSETVEKNYNDFYKFLFLYVWLAGWCTVCLYCLYQPFMKIWVGTELMLGKEIVVLMCMYFFLLKSGDICYVYRQAAGIWWKDKFRPIVEAISNLVLNIVLVKYFGVAGVLVATIITMLTINLLWGGKILFSTYFKTGIGRYIWKIVLYSCVTIFACLLTNTVCELIRSESIVAFVAKIIICCIIPNIIFFLFYFKTEEFKSSALLLKKAITRNK